MPDSLRLAVDPYLLCLPNPCNSLDQIEGFINALLGWSGVLRRQDARVLVSDTARVAVLDDGEYPYQHRLRELMRTHKCEIADPETVCRLTQNLLERTPSLEESYGVRSILIDETKTRVAPCVLVDRLKSRTRSAFIEMLVIVSVEQQATISSSRGSTVVASAMDDSGSDTDPSEVYVDSEVHDWSWIGDERHVLPPFPAAIAVSMPIATSHDALLQQLGVWKVWDNARDEDSATNAINLCIEELLASGVDGRHRERFQLGTRFLESARHWSFSSRSDYARLLVETCARIVLNVPKNTIDTFHEAGSATRQRRRRDGALAFRTHLTKKGAGLRLMLWKLPDGTIEFANVGDKDELTIL
jgi:hypothetical protein